MTRLVLIISTDDKDIMDTAVKKHLVKRVDLVSASEPLKTPVQEEEGSSAIIEKEGVPRPKPDGDVDSAEAQAVPKGLPFIIIISLCMYMSQKGL